MHKNPLFSTGEKREQKRIVNDRQKCMWHTDRSQMFQKQKGSRQAHNMEGDSAPLNSKYLQGCFSAQQRGGWVPAYFPRWPT
jgi:hypothetical protein